VSAALALYVAAWTVLFAHQLEGEHLWGWSVLKWMWLVLAILSGGAAIVLWLAGERSTHTEEEGMNLPKTSIRYTRGGADYPGSRGGSDGAN
jgi:H+/Cl- antiporter ClcA